MSALETLRQLIKSKRWSAYLIPKSDQHQSQYLCQSDQRIRYISGFSGSNAIGLVTQTQALLWTDSRYYEQAAIQLNKQWQMKKLQVTQKKWFEHIAQNYKQGIIGVDPRLLSAESGILRKKYLEEKGIKLECCIDNLIDKIWTNKSNTQKPKIFIHEEWAGKTINEKVEWVRQNIKTKNGLSAIFNDLSEIAWILNLRSSQIPHNPFFKSILIITIQQGSLYLPKNHPSLNDQEIISHLKKVNISIQQYQPKFGEKALITKCSINFYIFHDIQHKNFIEWDGIKNYRAVRTQKQLNGFKRCHLVDGIAMAKFWGWRAKKDQVDQYEAALHINNLRYQQQHNKGLSFDTISGGGPNAAIIHYHPTQTNHSIIKKNMIHLLDSGGQYLDGTTDVTRTYHFGEPTKQQKDAFTRVLLGNLDVQRLKWPKGSQLTGQIFDSYARRHLWNKQLDYGHGTGHGVGHFQGVHQGPVGISKYNKTVFLPGMIVTNEPGYYEPGKFGIRIQNILLVKQQIGWRSFQNLTLCPYDKNLIDRQLLSKKDEEFINLYHKRVWDLLSPHLQNDKDALQWLQKATSPL